MAEIPYICLHEIIVLDKRIIPFPATAEQGVHYAGYPQCRPCRTV